jgi:hypothetical protein
MILAYLLLLTGLIISAVAIYYSVVGLTAIFSAAVIPIIIMGSALEVGKLVCASWLKANWERAPRFMKYYMITAVMVLMLITSMGIFGFLSKAHNDQNLVSGDVTSKIALYDEKIKIERENIDANRKALKQMDEAVDQVMGRSQDEKGADKAVAIRRAQQKERARIIADIAESQKKITVLNEERAPIAAEVRKVEAEVGPIKYIAKFIYGDHGADENSLERAVTWIIIMIVVVFDPLAVIMLLAAQMTFGWLREQKEQVTKIDTPLADAIEEPPKQEEVVTEQEAVWPFPTYAEITPQPDWGTTPIQAHTEEPKEVEQSTEMTEAIEEAVKWSEEQKDLTPEEAKQAEQWAEEQVKPDADFPLVEESKKKDDVHDQATGQDDNQREDVGYIQNAEQNTDTLWARIQRSGIKARDELYKLYGNKVLETLVVDPNADPELYKFIEETNAKGPKFSNYAPEKIESFVSRIYELRENQRNNPA